MELFKEHLKQRPSQIPLPSWQKSTKMMIVTLKNGLSIVKDNIHLAQLFTKVIHPIPWNISVKKTKIPRRNDYIPEGLLPTLATGQINAEYICHPDASQTISNTKNALLASCTEKIIIYGHGGAFCVCSPQTHRGIIWRLSKYSKCRVLSIDYRLSPQHTFPAALHDMISAFLYLIDPPEGHVRYLPHQVIFAGDSAGGNLAITTVLWLQKNNMPLPLGLACLSPWLDLTHSMPSFKLNDNYDYLPTQSIDPKYINDKRMHYYVSNNYILHDPLISPLFATSKEFSSFFPHTLIQIGDAEKLRDESILFAGKFKNINVEMYQDLFHVFQIFSSADAFCNSALKSMGKFIQELNPLKQVEESKVIWCKRDNTRYEIENASDIIESGRRELIDGNNWTLENEYSYQKFKSSLV